METTRIELPRSEARDLYRAYKRNLHYSEPMDDEIRRTYQLLAQGRVVIRALESIRQAGLTPEGFPKLAIVRADKKACRCDMAPSGAAAMYAEGYVLRWRAAPEQNSCVFRFPPKTFPVGSAIGRYGGRAITPLIPVQHRPRRALQSYHVLYEAEWTRTPPSDPMLLRRIGKSDLWLVLAIWDLTEVERAVLQGRVATA